MKNKAYEGLVEMSRNDDYTTGNLLDYLHYQEYYKLIGIDLSRQKNMNIPQQINFIRKLEEDGGTTMFFLLKSLKRLFKLVFRFIKCNRIIQTREHQKILNLLNETSDSKFVTRKWNIVNDQSNANDDVGNEII